MALGRPIAGTPWFIVVEFPDHIFVSQAGQVFKRLALWTTFGNPPGSITLFFSMLTPW